MDCRVITEDTESFLAKDTYPVHPSPVQMVPRDVEGVECQGWTGCQMWQMGERSWLGWCS